MGVKISDLTAASSVADANEFEINESGTSKKVTAAQIKSYATSSIDAANLTGTLPAIDGSNLTGVQAASVNVTESSDDNVAYNVLFSDTANSGTVQMTPAQDDDGLTFNPNSNQLYSAFALHQQVGIDSYLYHNGDTNTWLRFDTNDSIQLGTDGTTRLHINNSGVQINNAFTLPTADGSANQVLTAAGDGTTSWDDVIDTNFTRVSSGDSGAATTRYLKVATIDTSTPSTSNSTFVFRILLEGRSSLYGASQFRVHIRTGESTSHTHVVVEQEHNNTHDYYGADSFIFDRSNQSNSVFYIKLPNNANTAYQECFAKLEVAANQDTTYVSGSDDVTIHSGQSWTSSISTTTPITASWISKKFKNVEVEGNITVGGTVDGRDIATNIPSSLGTAGQVLTVNSGASAAEWADASGGGSSFTLVKENYSNDTAPNVTGNDSVGIGGSVVVSASDSVAMGYLAKVEGAMSVAIGVQAHVTSGATQAIAIGDNAKVNAGTSGVALGTSYVEATDAFAAVIGTNSSSYGAKAANAIAIGDLAKASHANAIVLGDTAASSAANEITLGSTSDTVRISSAYTLPTADGSANQVLTTNGSGVASWAAASGGGAWNLISTTTVSSTVTEAVIALTGSYTEYKLLVHNWQTIGTNGGNDILLRLGTASDTFLSGSTDYTWALRYNRIGGSGAAQGESTSAGSSYVKLSNYAVHGTTSGGGVYMSLGISNNHSTTYPTQLKWDMLHGSETGGTNATNKVDGGALSLSTIADHTHVKLYFGGSGTSNEFNEGIFKLYGIS